MLLHLIRKTIKDYNLISKGESVLIGLSGGADSVCVTHALYTLAAELDIKVYTAHVNHGIRGQEAIRDENFVHHFSDALGIKCFVRHADIPRIALEQGISEETAGRNVRYAFFDELCREHNIDKIVTAHNKNDNAETILMNFIRGSSVSGLCGIPYKRNNIIRPILNASRKDIEQYCKNSKLNYMTDSTNLEDGYTRNRIRHTLIPLIEKNFNPNFINTITDNSLIIDEYNRFVSKYTDDIYSKVVNNAYIDISKLHQYDIIIQREIVRRYLMSVYKTLDGISSVYVRDILFLSDNNSGTAIDLPDNIIIKNEYGKIIAEKKSQHSQKEFNYEIKIGERIKIYEISKKVTVDFVKERRCDGAIYLGVNAADGINIRNRRAGDKFQPFGMNGSKKLKQYFIDEKIPKNERDIIPIIEINGMIAAVGDRIDRNFLFRDCGIRIEFINM